jgi:hypothetical protein
VIFQDLYGWFVAAQPPATSPSGTWTTLVRTVQDNPTIALLGLLLAAFLAGFGVRKFFEDRQLAKLRLQLEETKEQLDSTAGRLQQADAASEAKTQLAARLRTFLSTGELRDSLAKYLGEFPPDKHEAILASLMRQLLLIPGHAWLCTPTATVRVNADFDNARGASLVRAEVDVTNDPLLDLRRAITSQPQLLAAMLELSLNGIARVEIRVDADHGKHITVMQGPGLNWSITTDTLQRVEGPPHGSLKPNP